MQSLSLLIMSLAVTGVVDFRTAQFPPWFRRLRLYLSGFACLGLGATLGFLVLMDRHMSNSFDSGDSSSQDSDEDLDGADDLLPRNLHLQHDDDDDHQHNEDLMVSEERDQED